MWARDALELIFPARIAGDYRFLLKCSDRPVRGAPWVRKVEPASVDYRMIRPVGLRSQTAVLPAGGSFTVRLQLRDCFENHIEAGEEHCDQLQVLVDSDAFYEIEPSNSLPRYVQVKFSFTSQTCDAFPVFLKYNGNVVASLQLLVLTADKLEVVNNYVTRLASSFFSFF